MTTITKDRLLTIKQWRETYGPGSNVVLPAEEAEELARIALASLEAEPVASCIIEDGCMCVDGFGEYVGHSLPDGTHQLYTAPPALVVPDEMDLLTCHLDGVTETYADGWNACRAAMLQGSQPVSQTYNLPELIEGMEVSIDVSTCDADLGNRYFGTVTEALELDTAKNGYILLVQDAEPNLDVNGNSPVTPDGWISCSERMPEETGDIIVVSDGIVMSGISYSRRDGFYIAALEYDDDEPIGGVTHWMPLPEPPQGVNRG
ncbi:DUF551 domain-containing protein [Escherichia coli]|nr:DUF551 domain-containing protein [Escherichia coli]EIQ0957513.1 DUF551 domain-containing protein [Escherichia coli]EIZ0613963.1 DUF551 domain-containing protein [Escherichia coli]EKP8435075.1 DUF551 domain-containing protein [Escherichia coli]HCQ2474087.1 DUF551 domain-containing protein [Escherichia coli]